MAVLRNPDGDSEIRTPPRAVIGRGPRSDVRVDDNACSTQHAEVFWSVDRWVVRDLDSRNGTWVDGVRLQPSEQSELRRNVALRGKKGGAGGMLRRVTDDAVGSVKRYG